VAKSSTSHPLYAVPRQTIADIVTIRLRHLILSGEIKDGSAMRQDALAEQMGTSRIPVREALSRLENEGLVVSFPHRGYVVTGLSRNDIEELFDLRGLIEPELMRHALPRITEHGIAEAQKILDEFDVALSNHDINRWGDLNHRFHMSLYAHSGRARTLEIVRGLLVNADRYTRLLLTVGDGIVKAREDHAGMLELCRKGHVNQAVALTKDHIQRASDELVRILDSKSPVPRVALNR
jgi:DNA-binding GntR family transcriptional regulator